MRLIDADALISAINKSTCNWAEYLWKQVVCDVINNQPTAFDTEKVVEQLEEVNMNYFLTIANTGSEKLDIAYGYASDSINKAIDIVKKGGVKTAKTERV